MFYQSGWRDFTGWSPAHERKEWPGEAGGVPLFSERPRGVDGCKPDSVQRAACAERLDGHLSHSTPCGVAGSLRTATNTRRVSPLARRVGQATRSLLFCLAPHGVFRAPSLALGAVGFYPAFSPLPPGLHRGGRYVLCDTFRRPGLWPRPPAHSTRHAALWCPDFPLPTRLAAGRERPSAIGEDGRRVVRFFKR